MGSIKDPFGHTEWERRVLATTADMREKGMSWKRIHKRLTTRYGNGIPSRYTLARNVRRFFAGDFDMVKVVSGEEHGNYGKPRKVSR